MKWLWNHIGIIGLIWALLIVILVYIWHGIFRHNDHMPSIEDVQGEDYK